jgi:hypothetical protein
MNKNGTEQELICVLQISCSFSFLLGLRLAEEFFLIMHYVKENQKDKDSYFLS